ncbi:hypothetical protein DENSPDRAFT_667617 [Dentipellis sp. KUC8613]|nr:hypothetical protein DENSPDRAFT_667617 [Dentipellis sp. KUC8613]
MSSAPSPAFSPYRYDSEPHHSISHNSYPQLQSHQHTPSYHTPYFHGPPPSLTAPPSSSGFLHASASFPPGGASSSHSHAPTLRSAGFSSPVSQMYPPSTHRSTQQPPPRISQPTSQSSQQPHSHQTSPDDIFAGVFGPAGAGAGAGGGVGVGVDLAFPPTTLTFDWPQLSAPPPQPSSSDAEGGPSWLDYLTGPDGLLGQQQRQGEPDPGGSPRVSKRAREDEQGIERAGTEDDAGGGGDSG